MLLLLNGFVRSSSLASSSVIISQIFYRNSSPKCLYSKFAFNYRLNSPILFNFTRYPRITFRHFSGRRIQNKNANVGSKNLFLSFFQKSFFNANVTNNNNNSNEWEKLLKLPLMKRMNVMFKKYWYIAIPLHCINSALWFASMFFLVKW